MKKLLLYFLILISFASFGQFTKTQLHTGVTNNIRPGLTPFKVGNQLDSMINSFQLNLVSGTNIKTINSTSLLGSGNLVIGGITNSAPNTYLMMSDGTNAITSGLSFNTGNGFLSLPTSFLNINGRFAVGPFSVTPARRLEAEENSSTSNDVLYALRLSSVASVTPAVGKGVGKEYQVETANSVYKIGGTDEVVSTNIGTGTETFDRVFKLMTGGASATERFRIKGDGAIRATATGGDAAEFTLPDVNTNLSAQVFRISHTLSSGSASAGIGAGMSFMAQTGVGNNEIGAVIDAITTDVTSTSEDFDLVFRTMTNGAVVTENLRVNTNGISTNSTDFVKFSKASATLDFPNTTAGTSSDLTITLTGAALSDTIALGYPNGSVTANSCYTAWVSATNTITVRFNNYDPLNAANPASGTFKITLIK